jgi:hypothetical protein
MSEDTPNPSEAHEDIADEAEAKADDLETRGEEVSEHIEETKKEWESARESSNVPGANPPDLDDAGYRGPAPEDEAVEGGTGAEPSEAGETA